MTYEEALKTWEAIDFNKMLQSILKDLEPELIDLNVEQLARGEGKSGSKFPTYANEDYYNLKVAGGLTEGSGKHYNLLLTGLFREKMFLEQKANKSFINSRDEKTPRLRALTDDDIFGLQRKNLFEIENNEIEPAIIQKLEKIL